MVLTFIFLTSATIILLSTILYSVFTYATAKDLNKYNLSNLNSINAELSSLQNQTTYISSLLLNKKEVLNYFYCQTDAFIEKYHLSLFVKDLYSMYPFISFIEFYSCKGDKYYNTLDFANVR